MHKTSQNKKSWVFAPLLAIMSLGVASAQPYAYVANGGPHTLGVLDTSTNTFTATTITLSGAPNSIAVTPDGSRVYAALGTANAVAVVSTATSSVITTIPVGSNAVRVILNADGSQAYVMNQNSNSVSIIDTGSNKVLSTLTVGSKPIGAAFSPDGTRAYVTNSYGASVSIINTSTRTVLGTFSTGGAYGSSGIVVLPNGNIYVANQFSNNVTVHNPSGTIIATLTGFSYPNWLAKTPDNSKIYVSNGNGNSISAINTANNTTMATIPVGSNPSSVAVSADGSTAYGVLSLASELVEIDTGTNAMTMVMPKVGPSPADIAMMPQSSGPPPPPPTCTYTLSASSANFGPTGGTGSVNVTTNSGCAWTAASNTGIASITSGASGSGSGTVNYSVLPNGSSVTLSGTLTIAGQTYSITETGVPCTYTLSGSGSFTAAGGPGSVSVTAPAGCGWSASSNSGWATITGGASGSGSGSVSFSVSPNNAGTALSGSLTVAGQSFPLSEAGVACTYSLSGSGSFTSAGGPGSVTVTAPSGCAWSASSNSQWASITAGASGSGNGSVSFAVSPNAAGTTLNGSLTVAGQSFPLSEAGVACTYSLSGSGSFTSAGGPGSVTVTAPSGCAWSASSNSQWASITAGASGSGNGSVSFAVSPNAAGTTLNGSLTVAGQTFALTESGVTCTYALSGSGSFTSAGGPGSVTVTAPSGCSWTASSNSAWASITSGGSGSGNGSVSFSVTPNSGGTTLNGSLTVAGQTFALTESGLTCTYTLSANSGSFTSAGGPGSVGVTAPSGCSWTASSNSNWASITAGSSGSGNGSVSFSVSPNSGGTTLNGSLTVAGQTFTLTETGVTCTYNLSAPSASFAFGGGPGAVNVTAPSGCSWTASSTVGWVSITAGASGSGNGTVAFSVNANNTGNSLTGTLNVAGQAFTVNEGPLACTYSLSSNGVSLTANGGTGSVNVTAPVGCAWTASTDSATWLNVTNGFSGNGNGTVSYSAVANGGVGSRSGNLTVGGQTFAVSETGESFSPIYVRAGGPQYTDPSGNVWVSDNATNFSVTNASIANTTMPALYQTEAWSTGTLQYQYTVPNGTFNVTLKFAEFYMTAVGSRTFNIVVNGNTQYSAFDILAHAGAMNAAYDVTIPVVVNNGQITIQLVPVVGSAKVNAIEITQ